MARKTFKQRAATARRQNRELRSENQTGMRRGVASVIRGGTAYAGTAAVYMLQKDGNWNATGTPWDVFATGFLQFLGDVRALGGASDIVREIAGGHTSGRLGGMAVQHQLGIRYVEGKFVDGAGDALPPAATEKDK